jgi:ATP-dependent helicase HrpA
LKSSLVIQFPEQLPVSEKRAEIARAIQDNQVVVIAGETGSGKTTQIPKICLSLGYGENALIGHTQPRRLAARSVASRIAEELHTQLGQGVGYQVRFSDNTGPHTRIKLMTDGILLAEIQQDRMLRKYEVLIIDEAHERSLNIDFLLGYLKTLCAKRKDLKVIITSATIDVEKFSKHFYDAPIITVSGRNFPVDIVYLDPAELIEESRDEDPILKGLLYALDDIRRRERIVRRPGGDVLVFLSGERDIRDTALALRKLQMDDLEVVPLYARLSQNEQQKIFAPHTGRRVILSTNVAETSLTVPGISYVIDSGLARISRYSVQSKVQRLPVEAISQASANQRSGRCGRTGPGVCYRLFSESDFLSRPFYTDPEIQRTSLSAVVLQMLSLKLGEVDQFPFVEPPERRAINEGFSQLEELGAINKQRILTETGRAMSRIPADPRLARMLIEASRRSVLYEMLIIVAALSVQDPRDIPVDKRQTARERHAQFVHPESDFLFWVNLWRVVEQQRQDLSQSQFKQFCKETYLAWPRLREWRETHRQLTLACQAIGLRSQETVAAEVTDYESVHRSLLTGSLSYIGNRNPEGLFNSCRGRKFAVFPSSVLVRKAPKWVLSAELIETSRLFAASVARIEPDWIVDAAADQVRREYFEAHWEKKRGEVVAFEKISLYGLVILEKRRVSYAAINLPEARQIFIREALVAGEMNCTEDFFVKNQQLLAQIRKQEEKERRPDILVSDDELYRFYDDRLPETVVSVAGIERWSRTQKDRRATVLHMQAEDVLKRQVDENSQLSYPDRVLIQHNRLTIGYSFKPGSHSDGVSITVPGALLPQLKQADIDWCVPGLVSSRCEALIKSLPKSTRKQLVPVPEFVAQALKGLPSGDRPELIRFLTEQAFRLRRVQIPVDAWNPALVPAHLSPLIVVADSPSATPRSSKDLRELQTQLTDIDSSSTNRGLHPIEQSGLKDWSFGELPEAIELKQHVRLIRYPALRDDSSEVSIVLCPSLTEARVMSETGLARLYMFRTPQQRALIQQKIKDLRHKLGLKLAGQNSEWLESALMTVYRLGFEVARVRPVDRLSFEKQLASGRAELIPTAEKLCRQLAECYAANFEIRRQLESMRARFPDTVADIDDQLDFLFASDFPASVPGAWLWEYPRYIKAIRHRCEKVPGIMAKDREQLRQIAELKQQWRQLRKNLPNAEPDFLWWVEELRVSIFAQHLGTLAPVSLKRLSRALEQARLICDNAP